MPNSKKTVAPKKVQKKVIPKGHDDSHHIAVQTLGTYLSNETYLFDFSPGLATGGIFVKTTSPRSFGETLSLRFTAPNQEGDLLVQAKVIWVQSPINGRKDLTPGMGLQFTNFTEKERDALQALVDRKSGALHVSAAS